MWAYINNLAVLITINTILAVTLNFVLGYAGIFSMAHAVFFGIGAYTAALAAMKLGADFLLATACGDAGDSGGVGFFSARQLRTFNAASAQ